jgi:hypothetical protein
MTDEERIRQGLERRLSAVEALIPDTPRWKAENEPEPVRTVRLVVNGTGRLADRHGFGWAATAIVAVIVVAAALLLRVSLEPLPGAAPPEGPSPSVEASPSASPTHAGVVRPALEPRLSVPVDDRWMVVHDGPEALHLVHLLQGVGSIGYNVSAAFVRAHGVYDPMNESRELPVPADLIGWIAAHPDLDAAQPFDLVVSGRPARAVDVTVTYQPGGAKGQTAQFIDIGPGPWNLEAPSKKRIVVLSMDDRPLLIVYDARPEVFDEGLGEFATLLEDIALTEPAP